MKLKIKKLHPDAVVPKYATAGAACFDLHALECGWAGKSRPSTVYPGAIISGAATFRTGLSFEVPDGHAMLIFSRSGHGFKNDVRLSNCVGVIDSDYRGEVQVRLRSDDTPMEVKAGDRIAQAIIIPFPQVEFEEVEDLSDTERGTGGFGSTGQ